MYPYKIEDFAILFEDGFDAIDTLLGGKMLIGTARCTLSHARVCGHTIEIWCSHGYKARLFFDNIINCETEIEDYEFRVYFE